MKAKCKASNIFFCFNPKFDTGSWSIAFAFVSAVIFAAVFVMTLSYTAPKCACPQIWEHLDILPTAFKVIYVGLLLYFAALVITSLLVIYGTFKLYWISVRYFAQSISTNSSLAPMCQHVTEMIDTGNITAQHNKFPPYLILMICTELATFGMSIFIFVQLSKIEQYLLFDNDTYWNMAKLVLKEDLVKDLEVIMASASGLLKNLLNIDMGESLNLDLLMDAALKEGVLVVLGGMKRMMKVSAILMLIGMNSLFITSIMVVGSHHRRLKRGILRTYTGVPGLVIHKAVLTNSVRSTGSGSISDWSGTPMKKIKRTRSKDYSTSTKSLKRLYNTGKLDVEDKFPKGDFI